jgi:hypothetical protein
MIITAKNMSETENTSASSAPTNHSEIQSLTAATQTLSISADRWNTAYLVGTGVAVLFAFVAFALQFKAVRKTREVSASQTALLAAKDRELIADLRQKDAEIAQANEKTESLRRENLKTGMALLPRRLMLGDLGPLLEDLAKYPNTRALIAVVPDWEATTLASDIRGILRRFGHWDVKDISNVPPAFIDEGVTLVTLDENRSPTHTVEMSPPLRALSNLLERELGPPRAPKFVGIKWKSMRADFPTGTLGGFMPPADHIVILVGTRPLSLVFPMVGPDTSAK